MIEMIAVAFYLVGAWLALIVVKDHVEHFAAYLDELAESLAPHDTALDWFDWLMVIAWPIGLPASLLHNRFFCYGYGTR